MAASRVNGAGPRPDHGRFRFAPESQRALQDGIATLERVLGPTLGPAGRVTAIERIGRPGEPPELLDDASMIARRITGLPDRLANMGLMLARHAAWRMRRDCGDSAATAVTILAATHRQLLTYAAAGADPIALRRGVERAVECASGLIESIATPLAPEDIAGFAATSAASPAVAAVVAEAITVLGPDAVIVTRESKGREVTLECIDGALWESPSLTASLIAHECGRETRLLRPRVLIWDAPIDDPIALASALGALRSAGAKAMLLVARSYAAVCLALLNRNNSAEFRLAAATAPHEGVQQAWALADLAALVGGRVCSPDRGDRLDRLDQCAVGSARRAIYGPGFLNVLTAEVETPAMARQIAAVRRLIEQSDDEGEWRRLFLRLGRLRQGMGVIWVGAPTESERQVRLRAAERALASLRAATRGGVVPGGGAAYLAVARHLAERTGRSDEDLGVLAVAKALEAPARWIARNAGLDPAAAVMRVMADAPALGLDAVTGRIRDLRAAGIVDPAPTVVQALRVGATAAALASTCDALVVRPVRLSQADLRP